MVLILLLVSRSFANFHKCLMKGAMSVKQIALACSGPLLSSNVLNACIGRVAYVSTLMSLQQHGQTRPNYSSVYYHSITGIERGAFRLVDQKWYAPRPSNFVNVWIWCSGTLPHFLTSTRETYDT